MVWGSLLRSTGLPAATIGSTSRPRPPRGPRPPRLSASVGTTASVASASQLRRGVKAKNKEDTLVVEGRNVGMKYRPVIWGV